MSFEQIEKFQCLESSTTQGLSHGIFRTHVSRVQKRVSKCVNFWVQNLQKGPFYALPEHTSDPPMTCLEALH